MKTAVFWFRRDLRIKDNAGLYHALKSNGSVLPVFIFDTDILKRFSDPLDKRVLFIYQRLLQLKAELQEIGSDLFVYYGQPVKILESLIKEFKVASVYCNHDYEPSAIQRDTEIRQVLDKKGIEFESFKDHVIFEKYEILTDAKKPYTVYTPYKNKWLKTLSPFYLKSYPSEKWTVSFLKKVKAPEWPSLESMGYKSSNFSFPLTTIKKSILKNYANDRDFPALNGTTLLGMHLRFGTVSIRQLATVAKDVSAVWLSELIWRDFFIQILFHFPHVVTSSFRPIYDQIDWSTSESDLQKWVDGRTGYPIVDAGMRELNSTGHMHNRVRMIVASFLTKHLLIHWSKGEKYFSEKLLDYDLAANNGNWQWAAGSGCDAAPYFRIFNPYTQTERFDPDLKYVKKWVPEFGTEKYTAPMVDHEFARKRALTEFQKVLRAEKK